MQSHTALWGTPQHVGKGATTNHILPQHTMLQLLPPQQLRQNPQTVCRSSVREPKDPSKFASMDEAREYLMRGSSGQSSLQGGVGGPIAGLLNWLSGAAFGAGAAGSYVGSMYRNWLLHSQRAQQQQGHPSTGEGPSCAAVVAAAAPEVLSNLSLIMLVSEHRVQQLACRYPQVLSMSAADVATRLLLLKDLLPQCNVARMVELAPGLLLGVSARELHVAKQRVDRLTHGLPGADVAAMLEEDPSLLFEELDTSLVRLHELWPGLDAAALAASDPKHIALALRALSDNGSALPRRF